MDKVNLTPASRQWLLDQIDLWRDRKLVSADQADAILDLYETPTQSSARQQSLGIYVLLGVAAFFVALALFLAIGYNWEAMPAPLKLIVIIMTVCATYAAAFYVRFTWQAKIFSEVIFFLGGLFYGASIWLIAQIFHLNAHYPDGFWWWALGILPIALFLDTLLMHLLLVVLLATWVGTEILNFPGMGGWFFGRFPALPNGCYTLLGFLGLGLAWAYRKNSPSTVALYVPLLVWWVVLQPFALHLRENPIFFIGSIGALLLILAEAHEERSPFAIAYRLWGVLTCMVVLGILSFHGAQAEMARFDNALAFFLQTVLVTALAVAAFGAVAFRQARHAEDQPFARPIYALAVRQWLPLTMVAIMFAMTAWHAGVSDGNVPFERISPTVIVPTVVANVAMLGLAFWLLLLGLRDERALPFAGGVGYFLLWSVMRYIDLFGDFGGLLGASCMFFTCGVALAGFAIFWHLRMKDIREARRERQASEAERRGSQPIPTWQPSSDKAPETGIKDIRADDRSEG